jgi:hypothetical protein
MCGKSEEKRENKLFDLHNEIVKKMSKVYIDNILYG